jgi:hypothetical protein
MGDYSTPEMKKEAALTQTDGPKSAWSNTVRRSTDCPKQHGTKYPEQGPVLNRKTVRLLEGFYAAQDPPRIAPKTWLKFAKVLRSLGLTVRIYQRILALTDHND